MIILPNILSETEGEKSTSTFGFAGVVWKTVFSMKIFHAMKFPPGTFKFNIGNLTTLEKLGWKGFVLMTTYLGV